jgi:hypothetical protein
MGNRTSRSLRSALSAFWWRSGERAMVDLANIGAAPPIITGVDDKAAAFALYHFRETKHRPSAADLKFFRKRWQAHLYVYDDDNELVDIRDDLRKVFESPETAAHSFLARWGKPRGRRPSDSMRSDLQKIYMVTVQLYGTRFLLPEIDLALVISMAVLASLPQMTRCANPECPSPYFLRPKKTQRYCERPECIAHGQREHKLNWWRTHGKARRAAMKTAQNEQQKKKRSAVNTRRRHKRQ